MKKKLRNWLAAAVAATMMTSCLTAPTVQAKDVDRNAVSVVILGDDISAGVGLTDGESTYGELVASYLGTGCIANFAQVGATTDSLLTQLQTDSAVQESVAQADIILVSIGANDIYQTVLQNEYIDVTQYSTMQQVLDHLDSATRLNLSKYLRSAMPPVVANAVSNVQEIADTIHAANSDADIVFQDVYNPLSVGKDATDLTGTAPAKISMISTEVAEYLNGGGLIATGINTAIGSLSVARKTDTHDLLLNHGWYYTNVGTLGLQPNAIGQLAIAQAVVNTLELPNGNGTAFSDAYQRSGAAQSLAGIDTALDQTIQSLSHSIAVTYQMGDVDNNGTVDLTDATLTLTQYAENAVSNPNVLNVLGRKAADVDGNPGVDLNDATLILTFYCEQAVGNEKDFDEFIAKYQ